MNFNEINSIYKHMRDKIYPNVQTVWEAVSTESILLDKYFLSLGGDKNYQLLCVPYLVEPEQFFKRYKENCVIFYNTVDPNDGLMLTLHQIDKELHVHSRLFCWNEKSDVHDYLSILLFHKNYNKALDFINQNYDLAKVGDTEDARRIGLMKR